MPIGVFVAVVGLAFVWKAASRNSASVAQLMGYFMVAILLVLPTISRRICQTFRCKTYDGEHKFLEMDLEVCRVRVRVRLEGVNKVMRVSEGEAGLKCLINIESVGTVELTFT